MLLMVYLLLSKSSYVIADRHLLGINFFASTKFV